MRIPRLYIDQPLAVGEECVLAGDRFHYLINVLRLSPGRPLVLFNGQGGEYKATVADVQKKRASVKIERFVDVERESPLAIELAIGISKGDRMDWIVQKATELGVTRITPLFTDRSEVKLAGKRRDKKIAHWREVIVNACEQCGRNRLPVLDDIKSLAEWTEQGDTDCRLMLEFAEDADSPFQQPTPSSVALLVGPEGGFSEAEVALAKQKEFAIWRLGPRVLRTETAPVAALSILQHQWGDFSG